VAGGVAGGCVAGAWAYPGPAARIKPIAVITIIIFNDFIEQSSWFGFTTASRYQLPASTFPRTAFQLAALRRFVRSKLAAGNWQLS
jgi:hypothetical protein